MFKLNLRALSVIHLALTGVVVAIAVFATSPAFGVSVALGAGLILADFWLLCTVFYLALRYKKLIAFSFLIIVFKYLFLGVLIVRMLQLPWINVGALLGGVGVFVVSALLMATGSALLQKENEWLSIGRS